MPPSKISPVRRFLVYISFIGTTFGAETTFGVGGAVYRFGFGTGGIGGIGGEGGVGRGGAGVVGDGVTGLRGIGVGVGGGI